MFVLGRRGNESQLHSYTTFSFIKEKVSNDNIYLQGEHKSLEIVHSISKIQSKGISGMRLS